MQAIAAATFEGKPVDVDFGPGSGPAVGGGGGGVGSSSGMTYIHKMTVVLSSTLAARCSLFRFHSLANTNIVATKLKNSMVKNSTRGFTLIELLVVIAIIALIMALAFPAFTRAIERARATKDMIAMQSLLNDNDQLLPVTATWPGISTSTTPVLYQKYIATRKVFQSPFDKRPSLETDLAPVSYSINHNMYDVAVGISGNMLKVVSPASTFFMAPTYLGNASSWTGTATSAPDLPVGGDGETTGTHNNGRMINVLFCDWHTETLTFGPAGTDGTFQDKTSNLGLKHWDPRQ